MLKCSCLTNRAVLSLICFGNSPKPVDLPEQCSVRAADTGPRQAREPLTHGQCHNPVTALRFSRYIPAYCLTGPRGSSASLKEHYSRIFHIFLYNTRIWEIISMTVVFMLLKTMWHFYQSNEARSVKYGVYVVMATF